MAPPSTFERVYAALRQRLSKGRYRPGERLEPSHLADELNASVTPVRDALHRLTGERLVEAPPHEGFRVPALSEALLRQLYAWHLDLLLLALGRRASPRPLGMASTLVDDGPTPPLDELLERLSRRTDNTEHLHAFRAVRARLEPFEPIERLLLGALDQDTDAIAAAARTEDWRALRRALLRYHRRRNRLVPEILAAAYARAPEDYNRDVSGE